MGISNKSSYKITFKSKIEGDFSYIRISIIVVLGKNQAESDYLLHYDRLTIIDTRPPERPAKQHNLKSEERIACQKCGLFREAETDWDEI